MLVMNHPGDDIICGPDVFIRLPSTFLPLSLLLLISARGKPLYVHTKSFSKSITSEKKKLRKFKAAIKMSHRFDFCCIDKSKTIF